MLSLGVRLGVPWLVNPLLAGINILLTYLLIQEIFERKMARLVVVLLCVSPWHLLMSMNLMTHTFTMTCALGGGLLVAWAKRRQQPIWSLIAGGLVGATSLIRPLDGFIVAVLLGLWLMSISGVHIAALDCLHLLLLAQLPLGLLSCLTTTALLEPLQSFPLMHTSMNNWSRQE